MIGEKIKDVDLQQIFVMIVNSTMNFVILIQKPKIKVVQKIKFIKEIVK